MSETRPHSQGESILVADCGSTTTKVVLLDVVDGQYRFVGYGEAPSTVDDTWDNASLGVARAVRQLEQVTGQAYLDGDGRLISPERLDGAGVDRFYAVSSAARPLRVVLVGLSRGVSLSSARRAALHTYTEIVEQIALEQKGTAAAPQTVDDMINAIWHAAPDVLCVVGGTDGGATEPVLDLVRDVVRVALYLLGERLPAVIYAGNARLREAVTALVEEVSPLHVVDNVRPTAEVENLGPAAEEIDLCFYEQQLKYLPGGDVLQSWGSRVVLPAARTADYSVRYCDRAGHTHKPALCVDVGSANVTLNLSQNGQALTAVRTDLGVGHSMATLLEQVAVNDILRWLPFEMDAVSAYDRLRNKALRPGTIPQTHEDLLLEQAAVREVLRLALRDLTPGWAGGEDSVTGGAFIPPCDPLIASGGVFAHLVDHGQAVLMLLDALLPAGISDLYLDEYDLIAMLGALAQERPLALVQTLRSGGLTYLGTAVAPLGRAGVGERALLVHAQDGALRDVEVMWGTIRVLAPRAVPLGTSLTLRPARGLDIGAGRGKAITLSYKGGTVGLVIDARGRPLPFARDSATQRGQVGNWLRALTSAGGA
ncbi:MAG: glutamate mutase L [Anaerolineae bacterium]|nr:glutamate mutase L [Anaerolineae bacterium]